MRPVCSYKLATLLPPCTFLCCRAPEQFGVEPNGCLSTQCDVWAFGCTLLNMVTGQLPWPGLNVLQIAARITAKDAPVVPDNLPQTLKNLLAECFRQVPTERPTAAQLVERLQGMPDRAARTKAGGSKLQVRRQQARIVLPTACVI